MHIKPGRVGLEGGKVDGFMVMLVEPDAIDLAGGFSAQFWMIEVKEEPNPHSSFSLGSVTRIWVSMVRPSLVVSSVLVVEAES
jgi:hypothetical protein